MNDEPSDALAVEVISKKFATSTDRAQAASMELFNDLQREFGRELPEPEKTGGSKGDPITVGAIVLALITSGAVVKALECVKAWIERDPRDRVLRVHGSAGGKDIDFTVTAENVGDEHLAEIIRNAVGVAP
jgi:hypothetical protein